MILVDFQEKIGISRSDAENWLARLDLSTAYAPTVRGIPRNYSRENVLELAFLAALIKTGWPPRRAVGVVRDVLADTWGPVWLAWPAGRFEEPMGASHIEALGVEGLAKQSPHRAISAIHIGDIRATVDRLFSEKGES